MTRQTRRGNGVTPDGAPPPPLHLPQSQRRQNSIDAERVLTIELPSGFKSRMSQLFLESAQ